MDPTDSRAAITAEAARWWARLCARDPRTVSRADREAFTYWLRASPVHVAELLHVSHVHHALEHFREWKKICEEVPQPEPGKVVFLPHRPRKGRSLSMWLAAAALAALTFLVVGRLEIFGGRTIQTAQ